MLRKFDIALIGAMAVAATVTYVIKHQTDEIRADIRTLQAEIDLEEDTIDLLEADWSFLNQPSRLQKLVELYEEELQLQATAPEQLGTIENLPAFRRDVMPMADGSDPVKDAILTGSVSQ